MKNEISALKTEIEALRLYCRIITQLLLKKNSTWSGDLEFLRQEAIDKLDSDSAKPKYMKERIATKLDDLLMNVSVHFVARR